MKQLLLLLALTILSCRVDRDVDEFDIHHYYTSNDAYAYTITKPVEILDTIPSIQLTVGTKWTYYTDNTYNKALKEEITLLHINGNLAQFQTPTGVITVVLTTYGYSGFNLTSEEDTVPIYPTLPLPHISQLTTPYDQLTIRMDDGTACYSLGSAIFSSRYGRIQKDPALLIKFNGGECERIGRTINEFAAKERWWFQ